MAGNLSLSLMLGSRIGGALKPSWVPDDAVAAYNALTDQSYRLSTSFSRSSTALWNPSGEYQEYATNVLRRADGVGALLEVGSENANTRFSYTAGLWSAARATFTAIPFSLVPGVDAGRLTLDGGNDPLASILATVGTLASRTFTMSFWARIQDTKGMTGASQALMYGNTGVEQVKTFTFTPTTEWQRFEFTGTFSGAVSTALTCRVDPWGENHNNSPVAGAQLDIGGWQVEEGHSATTPIITSGATATRAGDELTLTPTSGAALDWHARYDDDSEDVIASGVTGAHEIDPATLTRPGVKLIWATEAA